MKNLLLFGLAVTVFIALFSDGGLEVSPNVSPSLQFKPALEFKPNVSYAPETTTNTTRIDTNIESQTNIENQILLILPAAPAANQSYGSTTVDPVGPGCQPAPGETIVNGPDIKGTCTVQDQAGNRFFINVKGVRWLMGATSLQPQGELTLEQLQAAFLRNGGELPTLYNWWGADGQMDWLKRQSATWQ